MVCCQTGMSAKVGGSGRKAGEGVLSREKESWLIRSAVLRSTNQGMHHCVSIVKPVFMARALADLPSCAGQVAFFCFADAGEQGLFRDWCQIACMLSCLLPAASCAHSSTT